MRHSDTSELFAQFPHDLYEPSPLRPRAPHLRGWQRLAGKIETTWDGFHVFRAGSLEPAARVCWPGGGAPSYHRTTCLRLAYLHLRGGEDCRFKLSEVRRPVAAAGLAERWGWPVRDGGLALAVDYTVWVIDESARVDNTTTSLDPPITDVGDLPWILPARRAP